MPDMIFAGYKLQNYEMQRTARQNGVSAALFIAAGTEARAGGNKTDVRKTARLFYMRNRTDRNAAGRLAARRQSLATPWARASWATASATASATVLSSALGRI